MKVSVIITAYRSQMFIKDCLNSIFTQSQQPHEILLGIDDCMETYEAVRGLSTPKLKTFYFDKIGTYPIRNTLATIATGTHILFVDSDDVLTKNAIETLSTQDAECVRFKFLDFKQSINDASVGYDSHAFGAFIIKTELFLKVGGFINWKCSADAEFHTRTQKIINTKNIDDRIYYRRVHQNQLTAHPDTAIGSIVRTELNKKWRDNIDKPHIKLFTTTQFKEVTTKRISFNVATYPARNTKLKRTIESIYNQVDVIRVYLNEYDYIPDFLQGSKFEIAFGLENLKDSGKFYWADTVKNEYYITGDDDIQFPPDYAQQLINGMLRTGADVVTVHGRIFPAETKCVTETKQIFHYFRTCKKDIAVNYCGTGCSMIDNSKLTVDRSIFETHGMADQFFSVAMQNIQAIIYCLKHEGFSTPEADTDCLWSKYYTEYKAKTMQVLSRVKWKVHSIKRKTLSDIETVYINLQERKDRNARVKKAFKEQGIKATRFNAIKGNKSKYLNEGQEGIWESITQVLEINAGKQIAIYEDDVYFSKRISEVDIEQLLIHDLVFLGASEYGDWREIEIKIEHYNTTDVTCGLFAVIYSERATEILSQELRKAKRNTPIDNWIAGNYQRLGLSAVVIYPNIVIPDVRDSNLQQPRNQQTQAYKMRWNLNDFEI